MKLIRHIKTKVRFVVIVAVMIFCSTSPTNVLAVGGRYDPVFFGKNDIVGYNPEDTGFCDPTAALLTDSKLQRILQVLIYQKNPTNNSIVESSAGRYQFSKDDWIRLSSQYYTPALAYETASSAPSKIQDAVAFLYFTDLYITNEKDVFKTVVDYYYPEANIVPELLTKIPPGKTVTAKSYADAFLKLVDDGTTGSKIELNYKDATIIADSLKDIIINSNLNADSSTALCSGSGDIASLVLQYAWPDHRNAYTPGGETPKPEYRTASDELRSKGVYVGTQYTDCGGFITAVMINSGYEPEYNYSGTYKGGTTGGVSAQAAWLDVHWKSLGHVTDTSLLKPGDVAISPIGHTWMYVGPQDPSTKFETSFASASQFQRVPMAAYEGLSYANARWYTKG